MSILDRFLRRWKIGLLITRNDLDKLFAILRNQKGVRQSPLDRQSRRITLERFPIIDQELRGEGFDILLPRRATDDPAALVERFARAGAGGVLLGARTFWQGLDIPGPALQAVVIEKLPFEVPTELRRRREQRLKERGISPFGRYALGKMLLNLKQMVGRLIRTEEDRGVVVIVEGRPEKRYFRRLSEALPDGCEVRVTQSRELLDVVAEVGIEGGSD